MDDLTAFILARLDEDEAAVDGLQFACRLPDKVPDFSGCGGPAAEAYWRHFDPARVLREVAAGRAILARYEDWLARTEDPAYPQAVARDQAREYEDYVLPALAAVWSDHPDYRPEWGP